MAEIAKRTGGSNASRVACGLVVDRASGLQGFGGQLTENSRADIPLSFGSCLPFLLNEGILYLLKIEGNSLYSLRGYIYIYISYDGRKWKKCAVYSKQGSFYRLTQERQSSVKYKNLYR